MIGSASCTVAVIRIYCSGSLYTDAPKLIKLCLYGRESDGESGARTLWIGTRQTVDAAAATQALWDESVCLLSKEMT